ncbi:MAG: calcium-binding protein, partial [Pseudomonadota bacterium]
TIIYATPAPTSGNAIRNDFIGDFGFYSVTNTGPATITGGGDELSSVGFAATLVGDLGALTYNGLTLIGGNDTLTGSFANDRLYGEYEVLPSSFSTGTTFTVLGGADVINGGGGADLIYGEGRPPISPGLILNRLGGNDTINGEDGNDTIDGGSGQNDLNGGDGIDTFFTVFGSDQIDGGALFDTVDFSDELGALNVELAGAGLSVINGGTTDILVSIEGIIGTIFDDTITGASANESLQGGQGNDLILTARSGNPIAAPGVDTIEGGLGSDTVGYGPTGFSLGAMFNGGTANTADTPGAKDVFTFEELTTDHEVSVDALGFDNGAHGVAGTFTSPLSGLPIATFAQIEVIRAGLGDDLIRLLVDGIEEVSGGGGADSISGALVSSGFEALGGAGNDFLLGGDGDDTLRGENDSDTLTGNDGEDLLFGGGGDDTLLLADDTEGDEGQGGDGDDRIIMSRGSIQSAQDSVDGGADDDTIVFEHYSAGYNLAANNVLQISTGAEIEWENIEFFEIAGITLTEAQYLNTPIIFAIGSGSQVIGGTTDSDIIFGKEAVGDGSVMTEDVQIDADGGDDLLIAFGGKDELFGGDDDDTLDGGAGNDTLNGGDQDDTADYSDGTSDISANLNSGVAVAGVLGTDTLIDIENLIGGSGDDTVFGSAADNRIEGGAGGDLLAGVDGDDTLIGGDGQDSLSGGNDQDSLEGGGDDDRLFGNNGDDVIRGGDGDDTTNGGNGNDTIFGGADDDNVLVGGADDDDISGGEGSDGINGSSGDDSLMGDNGDDRLFGATGEDTLEGGDGDDTLGGLGDDDTLIGGEGEDGLGGGGGNDFLDGGAENDRLFGGTGNDTLIGGKGDDLISGQSGIDTFIFEAGWGHDDLASYGDVASDAARVDETIDLSALGIGFGDLTITSNGNFGTLVYITAEGSANNTIDILFRPPSEITIDDFLL